MPARPSPARRSPPGHSLVELLIVLSLVGILAAAAVPRMTQYTELLRLRRSLDRIVAELYRGRMLAVQSGRPVRVVLGSTPDRCIQRITTFFESDTGSRSTTVHLEPGSGCIRHNGGSDLVYNGRGMLRPPSRSIYFAHGLRADSLVLSIAGRVRRTY